eukprot:PITA_14598
MDLFSADLGMDLRIVNIYAPCSQREAFWQHILQLPLLNEDHVIIGGDLNFSLGFRESWGANAQIDPISNFMINQLEQSKFIDVPMQRPLPTWRNRRVGDAALARRLDRFLLKEPLTQHAHLFRQWVGLGGISDHNPIYLEILGPSKKPKAPYKFNHTWLKDPTFIKLIKEYWSSHPIDDSESYAKGFCRNLTELKHISIQWAKEKLKRDSAQLTQIEADLFSLTDDRGLGFISADDKDRLIDLERQRAKILIEREESIRLRSRALWLQAGDDNSKFFHCYAKSRKVSNTIWKLPSPDGGIADNFQKIAHLGTTHFRNLYKSPREANLLDIIYVANHFPRFVEEEDLADLTDPVTAEELEGVLKWFNKDKSPGPDGWTIEFYLAFFEELGQDLLRVVEESRATGTIYHANNSTFIALIPKSDSPASFDDYRPISLCNCLYKIISKIIANRLRPILSRSIAPQQFAFLDSKQIHEAIGLAQEALHSIWSKKLKAILLKIDLSKAFDRVSWLYLKMILIHLGFPHSYISWIMACITSPSFSILINGSASTFFHSERGLRQGCPLSPLLFLLVMEGLSRLMEDAKRAGDIGGLGISDLCYLTHLLFVDDVLILLDGSIRDSRTFLKILQRFSAATGMLPNQSKSTITCARTSVQETRSALQAFPYSVHPLDSGFKYLGFNLKPTCQRIADWVWLVAKLEKRLIGWSHRYLSRAGRLVLIKSVLEATPVFWMALAWIPRNILGRLQQLCNRYLWNGSQEKRIFAWISWKKISLPKKWGGWGLKDLPAFAKALAAKMGWTLLSSQNLWTHVTYHKYIWPQNMMDWARLPTWSSKGCSTVWKALIDSLPLIRDNLAWRINDGMSGRIGLDPWNNSGGRHILNQELTNYLQSRGIRHFAQIADPQRTDIIAQAWKSAQSLDLPVQWHQEWDHYTMALSDSHIRIKQGPDELIWCPADHGSYAPKYGYNALIAHRAPEQIHPWSQIIWKLKASPRSKLFFWCALHGSVPTGEQLIRRAIHGPTWCTLCKNEAEFTNHIFLLCPTVQALWRNICQQLGISGDWCGPDIQCAWGSWYQRHLGSKAINLPPMVTWYIWLARNRAIFEDRPISSCRIEVAVNAAYQLLPDPPPHRPRTIQPMPEIDRSIPWGFFDGAANQAGCGGGFVLHRNEQHRYLARLGFGKGSNNLAELSALHNLLRNLLQNTLILKAAFVHFSCAHIYREHNCEADKLSKEALTIPQGEGHIVELLGNVEHRFFHRPYIEQRHPRDNSPIR